MILEVTLEFRGKSEKVSKDGSLFKYVNFEDLDGEASKFQCDNSLDLTKFKKGDKVKAFIDYSVKYGSLKVVDISKGN